MKVVDRIRRAVHDMEPNLKENDEGFRAYVVLLLSIHVGPSADRIARLTTYPRRWVRTICHRLRSQKIWRGFRHPRVACNWLDKEVGGVELACDANVALGLLSKHWDG